MNLFIDSFMDLHLSPELTIYSFYEILDVFIYIFIQVYLVVSLASSISMCINFIYDVGHKLHHSLICLC